MAGSSEEVDQFVICLFKYRDRASPQADQFVSEFMKTVNGCGGNVHVWSDDTASWDIVDGRDNFAEPNHLNPAIFDFNCLVVCGFHGLEEVNVWWNSDEIFNLLKGRDPMQKIGAYIVDGLQKSIDVSERNRYSFPERLILFEFMKIEAFKPMQQYVDNYKRFTENLKMSNNLLFAEGVSGVLMNEFTLDAACASSWKMKTDAHYWYETELYQKHLMPLRMEYARCFTVLVPIFREERIDDLERARKMLVATDKLKMIMQTK